MMNKKIFLFLIIGLISVIQSQPLLIENGSFEGPPGPGLSPPFWTGCMQFQTPDTQPGFWGVNMAPSEGNTYLGLVHNVPGLWAEGASQQLVTPMEEGIEYTCTIDLAGHLADESNAPVELIIWGGFSECEQTELLWSSGDVPDFVWTTYSVEFTPSDNYTYILLQVNALTEISTYILVDNFSCENICPEPIAYAGEDQNINCENFINLSGNTAISDPIGGKMIGEWSIISGFGTFNSLNDPNTLVSNLSEGENIFQWTLTNDCGNSSDQVIINYIQEQDFDVPDQIYCLSSFELLSSIEGTWIVNDPLNMIIENPNTPNTIATPSSYGTFTFSFESCGDIVFIQEVDVLGVMPVISGNISSSCLDPISLNVSIIGDPGYWDYEGPGEAIFDNILSLNPTISVDTYGLYSFTYYGCGMSSSFSVDFITENPIIDTTPTVFCSLETTLSANSENPTGWTLINSPVNSSVVINNPQSLTTNIEVSDYGLYQFMFEGCGGYDIVDVLFETISPVLLSPEHEDCSYQSWLNAYTEDEDAGPWEQISGPSVAYIESPYENTTLVSIEEGEYGLYVFSYSACDTFSTIEIGFSCDPFFPNVFTPNGDENNDLFVIGNLHSGNYSESLLTIYNRWGEIVFLSKGYGLSEEGEQDWWDGKTTFSMKSYSGISADRDVEANQLKTVTESVYYYVFDVFNIAHNQPETFIGYITVIK